MNDQRSEAQMRCRHDRVEHWSLHGVEHGEKCLDCGKIFDVFEPYWEFKRDQKRADDAAVGKVQS